MKFFYLTLLIILLVVDISCRFKITKRRFGTYLKRFSNWPEEKKSTLSNDWGNSSTIFLDRHDVNCGIGALSGFRLTRQGETKYRYDYQCIMPQNCSDNCIANIKKVDQEKCKKLSTYPNILGTSKGNEYGKSTNYLMLHNVNCPEGFILTQFHLRRKPPKIYYSFTCCPAVTKECKSILTSPSDYGDYGAIYLDRQNVQVPDPKAQAVTGFKLNTDYGKREYYYKVDFCVITG